MNPSAKRPLAAVLTGLILWSGCGGNADFDRASQAITAESLASNIEILSSDEFEGRRPASPGGRMTTDFLTEEFAAIGLQPGNGESFLQEVPLLQITSRHATPLSFSSGGQTVTAEIGVNYTASTNRMDERTRLDMSDVIFVGYGIVAPEFGWDDYEGIDVRGKTVLTLVNDPGYATQDPDIFSGNTMTYYGRWTYKFEEAQRQGAAGVLVIHESGPAGYPFGVIGGGATRPHSVIKSQGEAPSRPPLMGWISDDLAQAVFDMAGASFDDLKAAALGEDFAAVALDLTASIELRNSFRQSISNNVLALLPGAERPDEFVVFMAHWDHLGIDESLEGDPIYNGAKDNASGTAALLELAKAFTALEAPPERSILFLAVTAEEQGLLGSLYYGTHPVYPLNKTVAAINMDVLNTFGPMNDMIIIGHGNSELDDYVAAAAKAQGRTIVPDPQSEKGFFFRSDHFSFAKQGVPSLYIDPGTDHKEHGVEWTMARLEEWEELRYHQVADEFNPDWDLRGAVDDIRLSFMIGYRLANESTFPNWREGNAFKAARDAMMAGQ